MEVRVLGTVEVWDGHALAIGGPRQRRIVAALAAAGGTTVSIDRLMEIVWSGEEPSDNAEQNLRSYVHRIRQGLGERWADRLETRSNGYGLRLEGGELDEARFVQLAADVERAAGDGDHARAVDLADDALGLWRGTPFADFVGEDWVAGEVARLEDAHARLAERRADSLLALGRAAQAVSAAEALTRDYPFREQPRRLLMLALYQAGRQPDALRAFQEYRALLSEEMGLDPSTELVDLEHRMLQRDAELKRPRDGGSGRLLRGYELDEVIGEGAFAQVWRGRQPVLGRDVAVKQIRPAFANAPEFIRRFEVEAQIVSSLEHPYIVPLYDYWREPDAAYLVMRMLRGGSLEDRLVKGPLGASELEAMVFQIGAALRIAHDHGVIHRDVKPANILLDGDGNFFLTDFGIAFGVAGEDAAAAALSTGSPQYASPEQLRRDDLDPRTDVYALGVTVYETATGEPPFAGERTRAGLVRRQLEEPLPTPSSIRPGIPAWVDDLVARATAKAPDDRFATVDELVASIAASQPQQPVADGATVVADARNPFKGLQPFLEGDAGDFRGRKRLVTQLVGVLERPGSAGRMVAVVGPSGAGKSSVVRAGLLPALRSGALPGSEEWFITTMRPGDRPFEELERALLRIAPRPPGPLAEVMRSGDRGVGRAIAQAVPDEDAQVVVVIDQFEELFTLAQQEERRDFLDGLISALKESRSRLRIVLTIRADFWDRPLRHPALAALLESATVTVAPLSPDELEQAIVDPVSAQGMAYEPGLVARITADVFDQPGALPLLQYTLTELFERNVSGLLTLAAYDDIGGLSGSLGRRADAVYDELDADAQHHTRRIFGRLVSLGEGSEDTRRLARIGELGDDPATARALDAFGSARLLAFDRDAVTREPTVEVAHEALIREWHRLRGWLDEDRDGLRVQRAVSEAADRWEASGRDPGDLLRGGRLAAAADYADAGELTEAEHSLVDASIDARDREALGVRRTNKRLRRLIGAVSVIAVLALVAGVVAFTQQRRAEDEAAAAASAQGAAEDARSAAEDLAGDLQTALDDAIDARGDAETARMASTAVSIADDNVRLGALLARESYNRDPGAETLGSIQETLLNAGPGVLSYLGSSERTYVDVRWSSASRVLALSDRGIEVFGLDTDDVVTSIDLPPPLTMVGNRANAAGELATFDLADRGATAAVAHADGVVSLVEVEAGEVSELSHESELRSLRFSHDGVWLAAGTADGQLTLWEVATRRVVLTVDAHPETSRADHRDGAVDAGLIDPVESLAEFPQLATERRGTVGIAFSRDDRFLITTEAPVVRVWDRSSGEQLDEHYPGFGPLPPVVGLSGDRSIGVQGFFDLHPSDPDVIVAAGRDDLYSFNWRTGDEEQRLDVPRGRADNNTTQAGVAIAADGTWWVALSDGTARAATAEGSGDLVIPYDLGRPTASALDPAGRRLAIAGAGGVAIVSTSGDRPLARSIERSAISDTVFVSGDSDIVLQTGYLFGGAALHTADDQGAFSERDTDFLDGWSAWLLPGPDAHRLVRLEFGEPPVAMGLSGEDPVQLGDYYVDTSEISPDGEWLTMSGGEFVGWRTVSIRRSDDLELVIDLSLPPGGLSDSDFIMSATWAPAGDRLLAATQGGDLAMWRTGTWEELPVPDHVGRAVRASFSPDGRYLATVDPDGVTALRDPVTFEVIRELPGMATPEDLLPGLRWSPDSRFLLGAFSRRARLWDVEAATLLGDPFPSDPGRTYVQGGFALATIVGDDVLVWNIQVDTWPDIACQVAGRNMTRAEWEQFGPQGEEYQVTCPQFPAGV